MTDCRRGGHAILFFSFPLHFFLTSFTLSIRIFFLSCHPLLP